MTDSTQELAVLAASGDTKAFGQLYELYFDRIYRYIYYRTLGRETAEDLCSKTFLKALDKLNSFKPERGSFNSWLYRIALNCIKDEYRKNSRYEIVSGVWDLASEEDHTIDTHNRIYWEKLRPVFEELPAEKREIVLLRIWDEFTFAEIAELTGKTESACKMSFGRTLVQLKDSAPFSVLLLLVILKNTLI
ncbi:MAG: sigma-70 family RNA polymerase sigma factor [Spirochaetales bacterium]|nr:sigma-70 family RNA polymerase sigma factor [Spirochaetales bacterium]